MYNGRHDFPDTPTYEILMILPLCKPWHVALELMKSGYLIQSGIRKPCFPSICNSWSNQSLPSMRKSMKDLV